MGRRSILQKKSLEQVLSPSLESTIKESTMQQGSFMHEVL